MSIELSRLTPVLLLGLSVIGATPTPAAETAEPPAIVLTQAPPPEGATQTAPPPEGATENTPPPEENKKKYDKRQREPVEQRQPPPQQGAAQDQAKEQRRQQREQQKALQQQQRQQQLQENERGAAERDQQKKQDYETRRQELQQKKAGQEQQRQQQLQENERRAAERDQQKKQDYETRRQELQQKKAGQEQQRQQQQLQENERRAAERDQLQKQDLERRRLEAESQKAAQEQKRLKYQQENNGNRPPPEQNRNVDRRDGEPPVVIGVPPPPRDGGAPAVVPTNDPNRRYEKDRRRDGVRPPVAQEELRRSYVQPKRQARSFEDVKRNRRERVIKNGNVRVIEEADRRVIVRQDNRSFIRHDETERFRRIAPDARTIRRADGTSTTFITRHGGVRIYDVTDRNGRLLYRYRRYPDGREVILIDNRRYYRRDKDRNRDVLIGAGIGLLIGSAVALAEPQVRIPRDRYIVDYDRASDDDLYEALTAPPIERLDRGYSLDEVRYSRTLRDRMRRIDLDTVTFDFGSWEVGPDQERALERVAEGINRALETNPDEIVMIEGHTDAVGSVEDNLTLSDRRAQSVAEILTTAFGVPPENLVTQGYGEEQLKVPTDGPERLNRRITVRRIGPLLSGKFEEPSAYDDRR